MKMHFNIYSLKVETNKEINQQSYLLEATQKTYVDAIRWIESQGLVEVDYIIMEVFKKT